MSEEQRLNSLDRFRKQPGRLVLEEHSHCEVPAGCGGVVLRWRNPHATLPLYVVLYCPVKARLFLDGALVDTGRIDLAPGSHLATLVLENIVLSAGLLLFAATHDPKKLQRNLPSEVVELPVQVVSAGDGSWKFSLEQPPVDWVSAAFDDADWPALVVVKPPTLDRYADGTFQLHRCTEAGAVCLGLPIPPNEPLPAAAPPTGRPSWWQRVLGLRPDPAPTSPRPEAPVTGTVWVRKVFHLAGPQERTT